MSKEPYMAEHPVARWHRLVGAPSVEALDPLVDEDAVFFSPVVHTPQRGKQRVVMYLAAAFGLLAGPSFRYVREIVGARDAMLEFETEIDGVQVNGVDLITWNEAGRIVEFKVMLRPLKAITLVHERMAAMLQAGR
jgi:hypothetical protein